MVELPVPGVPATLPLVVLPTAELTAVAETGTSAAETAVVAAGSAVIGAIVGGLASFQVNLALDARRRRARAAIRRKAKVYTPLRAELLALQRGMEADHHLLHGISRKERDPGLAERGPAWRLWKRLKDDGRAATSVSPVVRKYLDTVDCLADDFSRRRNEAMEYFDRLGHHLYLEIVGEELLFANAWKHGSALIGVLRDDADASEIFPPGSQKATAVFPQLREGFNASAQVHEFRRELTRVDAELCAAIQAAISTLKDSMAKIARKYEREEADD